MMTIRSFFRKAERALRFLFFQSCTGPRLSLAPGLGLIGRQSSLCLESKGAVMSLGRHPIIAEHVELKSYASLEIGDHFTINPYSRIVCKERILIGSNVLIARFVTILDHDHAYAFDGDQLSFSDFVTAPVNVGNNVWIGDKVTILKGVTIGDNVVLGANSLVSRDIPSNCIAAGNPCRVLRELSPSSGG